MSEKYLDVRKTYTGMLDDYNGSQVFKELTGSTTRAVRLLDDTGMAVDVGYFNNSAIQRRGVDLHAAVFYTPVSANLHHRLNYEQPDYEGASMWSREDDQTMYLEGYDDEPKVLSFRMLDQISGHAILNKHLPGLYVVSMEVGDDWFTNARSRMGHTDWRENAAGFGLEQIAEGNVIDQIDTDQLGRYASL